MKTDVNKYCTSMFIAALFSFLFSKMSLVKHLPTYSWSQQMQKKYLTKFNIDSWWKTVSTRHGGEHPHPCKGHLHKYFQITLCQWWRIKSSHLRLGLQQWLCSHPSILLSMGSCRQCGRVKGYIKNMQVGKKAIKLFPFTDNMLSTWKTSKNLQKNY